MNTRTKIIASFLVSCQMLGSSLAGETVEMTIETAIAVTWQSELSKNYRILTSTDLENWTVAISSVQGDGTRITRLFPKGSDRAFYRVEDTGQPTWLEGEWSGVASQDAAYEDWFDVTMRIQSGTRSFETTLVAPLGTCLMGMSLFSINDDTAEFTYTALEGGCDSGGKVTITRLSEDTVLWMDRLPADPALPAIYHGFAVLTRQ